MFKQFTLQINSIKTRLVLFYTFAAFILLSVIAIFLYWGTVNILYKADYQFLSNEVDEIQYLLQNQTFNPQAIQKKITGIPVEPSGSLYRYYVRLFDEKNNIIFVTPGMNQIIPMNKFNNALLKHEKHYLWYENNDTHYLMIEAPIKMGAQLGRVQIILDVSYQHNMIHDRNKLYFALLAGTLCALLIGFLVAHRGMRSLYLLTDTAKNITATSLHQRIEPQSWPIELRPLALQLNEMLARIEESFIRLKQFSADLSHELRTPVTNLISGTEVTLSYADSKEEFRNALESNLEELHSMAQMIENVLFLARAENPQFSLQKQLLNARKEIELIFEYHAPIAEEKNIALSVQGEGELRANPVMFKRAINNIMTNALKYTETGKIQCQIHQIDKKTVQIVISDTGIGIGDKDLPHIFDRFYRVDTSRDQRQGGGIGLGLPIVKSIIDLHHGSISVTSKLGLGTTFFLNFPV